MKQISDNEIYLLIKYTKSVLWRLAERLSYIEDARCLKVKQIGLEVHSSYIWEEPYLLTYLPSPWSRVLLEKLTVSQLVKKFPAFYGTRRFITATCPYPEPARSNPHPPHPTS